MKKNAKEIKKGTHDYTAAEDYVVPKQQEVLDKLDWFRDQKLALMMHFGIYSQLGLRESWPMCDKESSWSRKGVDWTDEGPLLRKQYFALNKSFNPIRLESEKWAKFAKKNGFKYLVFTTKHHDGFCLWDTKQTDYKVTSPDCPYSKSQKPDVVKDVFDAFRKEGLGITAYFSKPDWHCENFWEEGYIDEFTDRYPSYDPKEKPEKWEKFVQFTHAQIKELVDDCGPIDTLWFDGGWVDKRLGYDIRLEEIIPEVRKINPSLIVVDRTCGGEYENYITPEMTIPPQPIEVPWEACLSVSNRFSYRFGDNTYKSAKELIKIFVEIVAKGGNLALNIAPQPDGRLPAKAIEEVGKMGEWLERCGEAIYCTRICAPFRTDDVAFTQNKDAAFAIILKDELPRDIVIPYEGQVKSMKLLNNGSELKFKKVSGGYKLNLKNAKCEDYAYAIKMEKGQI